MYNSCLFILKCQLVKTHLKGFLPGEAQGARGDGLQRWLRKITISCRAEAQGGGDGPLLSPAVLCPACWGPDLRDPAPSRSQRVHLPPTEGFAPVPGLSLAKAVPVLPVRLCNQRGWGAGHAGRVGWGVSAPQHGLRGSGYFAEQGCCNGGCGDAAEGAGRARWERLPAACLLMLTSATFNTWEGGARREKQIISKVKQHKLMKDNFFCCQYTQRGKNWKLLRKRNASELLSKLESTEKPCIAELL